MQIKEYLKLSRSFNAGLTASAPVLGAISMWDVAETPLIRLFILFLIGFFGHIYGFALNDILDVKIDKTSKEISARPLISGKISIRNAWIFTLSSAVIAFILSIYYAMITGNLFFPIVILILSSITTTIYNIISKKYPLMDIFVAGGIFFLILYGASTVTGSLNDITPLSWLVCILGTVQVFFMQFIAGGLKDIENDFKQGAKTLAVKIGVRIENGMLKVPRSFHVLSYSIQILELILIFLPFYLFFTLKLFNYIQIIALIFFSVLMLFMSYKLTSMKQFKRVKARKLIGSHFQVNYLLVPIMLMELTPFSILLAIIPPLIFLSSNFILHGTVLQPKTM